MGGIQKGALSKDLEARFNALIPRLEAGGESNNADTGEWDVVPVHGGANNRLYRVSSSAGCFAVKFTIRDERDRARTEFQALRAAEEAGIDVAPRPILLQAERECPVVVQTWVDGTPMSAPPETDAGWDRLLNHYCRVHSVTPESSTIQMRKAFGASSVAEGRDLVAGQLQRVPVAAQPQSLRDLLKRFDQAGFPEWNRAPVTLARIDPNVSNFIESSDGVLRSVDWESSGWGDPAFDMADLMTHPKYSGVPADRWSWLTARYEQLSGDGAAGGRIWSYYRIMLTWWAVRSVRALYEVGRGKDQRLVERPHDWQKRTEKQYEGYLRLASRELERL